MAIFVMSIGKGNSASAALTSTFFCKTVSSVVSLGSCEANSYVCDGLVNGSGCLKRARTSCAIYDKKSSRMQRASSMKAPAPDSLALFLFLVQRFLDPLRQHVSTTKEQL